MHGTWPTTSVCAQQSASYVPLTGASETQVCTDHSACASVGEWTTFHLCVVSFVRDHYVLWRLNAGSVMQIYCDPL